MTTICFYGRSDDLIEVMGWKDNPGQDREVVLRLEFSATTNGDEKVAGEFLVGDELLVTAIYNGCWSFAPGQKDEETPLPEWPIRIRQEEGCPYSVQCEIDVPDAQATVIQEGVTNGEGRGDETW